MKYELVNENFKNNYGENLLKTRGIKDISLFMSPDRSCIQPPTNLENMEEGARLLLEILEKKEKILLVVDSDADGFTSATIMYKYIKRIKPEAEIDYLLHEGKQHGLEDHIDTILNSKEKYGLVILPDSSSNDIEYHDQLQTISLPVLVLDHHLTDNPISSNAIVINNQLSPKYQNKELTGAGVVYQFCRHLDSILGVDYAEDYLDLAALGIIGDMGSMAEMENRYFSHFGLKNIKNEMFWEIVKKQSYSLTGKSDVSDKELLDAMNPTAISFYVAPLINAMIRVGTMEEKTRLFEAFIDGNKMIPSGKRGAKGTLDKASTESARECTNARARQNKILDTAVESLEAKVFKHDLLENKILFIRLDDDDDFPAVLNGLCAMKMAAKFKKPTIVARLNEEGYIRGSARSVNDSPLPNLKSFFQESGYFEYAMGHEGAHGISIADRSLDDFLEWSNEELYEMDFGEGSYDINFIRAAADPDLENLVFDLCNYKDTWGQQNSEALIYIHDINLKKDEVKVMGKGMDTVKFEKFGITYIKFRAKDLIEELAKFDEIKVNLIGRANLNKWMGRETPQIFIKDCEVEDNKLGF